MTAQIIFEGDSLTLGADGTYPPDHYITLPSWEGGTFNKTTDGHSGYTLVQMLAGFPTNVYPLYDPTSDMNLVILWGGINDLYQGATPAQTYANLIACCSGLRANGFRVLVCTLFSAGDGMDAPRDAYNALIYAGWKGFADGIVDLAADPTLGPDNSYQNLTYFNSGGIHLTDAGYEIVGGIEQTAITNFLNSFGGIGTSYVRKITSVAAFPASGAWGDGASFTLPAGDWDLTAIMYQVANGSSPTIVQLGISTTSGNNGTGLVGGDNFDGVVQGSSDFANSNTIIIPAWRLALAAPTQVFMKVHAVYTGGTPEYIGRMSARRTG